LKQLLDKGLINQTEYKEKKNETLSRLWLIRRDRKRPRTALKEIVPTRPIAFS